MREPEEMSSNRYDVRTSSSSVTYNPHRLFPAQSVSIPITSTEWLLSRSCANPLRRVQRDPTNPPSFVTGVRSSRPSHPSTSKSSACTSAASNAGATRKRQSDSLEHTDRDQKRQARPNQDGERVAQHCSFFFPSTPFILVGH